MHRVAEAEGGDDAVVVEVRQCLADDRNHALQRESSLLTTYWSESTLSSR